MGNELLAGWGAADITPDMTAPVELVGQYYQRVARGVHSRLEAVALVVTQGDQQAAWVALDLVGFREDFAVSLQQAAARAIPELRPGSVIISATHTHTAPGVKAWRAWWTPAPGTLAPEAYRELVEEQVVAALQRAWDARRPCATAPVLENARIGHCRRAVYAGGCAEMYGRTDRADFLGMEGGEDSGVDLLFFLDAGRNPAGVIVNVACPSQVMEATYEISSDYMGALRARLRAEYGEDFHTLCQIGAGGCQSPRDLARHYKGEPDFWHADGVDVLAGRLFDAVRRGATRAVGSADHAPLLKHVAMPLALPRRRAGYAEYKEAQADLERLTARHDTATAFAGFCAQVREKEALPGRPGPYDDKLHPFVLMRNAEAVLRRYEEQDAAPTFSMALHVLRLGGAVFATNPFELFLEYGQRIKARSAAAQTFVVQLAQGAGGYLPTRRAEELGGYGGLIINGQVGSDGGDLLADRTVAAIGELWK